MNQLDIAHNFSMEISEEKIELMKRTFCKSSTDEEFSLFLHACARTGLDPFMRQIYAVKRWDGSLKREVMSVQTGIDGYRLIADRTGRYSPGKDNEFSYDDNGWPVSATAYVKKQTPDGTWHEISSTAYMREYCAFTKEGKPTHMWATKPHIMLGKCFTPDTEILTDSGFERLDNLKSKVLQYEKGNLSPVNVKAFKQNYDGDMISCHSDMVNFMVTPNHDMITTFGKVEAGAMYETSHSRGPWKIPMTTGNELLDTNPNVSLVGYILADGWFDGKNFKISVSKSKKIDKLSLLQPENTYIQNSKNQIAYSKKRNIKTNFDKIVYSFSFDRVSKYLDQNKRLINPSSLSPYECRAILEAWQYFDGHTNKKTGVRRIYTSRQDYVKVIDILAIKAGYSISTWKQRTSDISKNINWYATISETDPVTVFINGTQSSLIKEKNPFSEVWCVTVPSGQIVVRRNGFSMICGNCAEALALRKAFPAELSGLYTKEEMEQADNGKAESKIIPIEEEKQFTDDQIEEYLDKFGDDRMMMRKFIETVAQHYKWTITHTILEFEKCPEKTKEKFNSWKEKNN